MGETIDPAGGIVEVNKLEHPDGKAAANIREKVRNLELPELKHRCIYKVPEKLRNVNKSAYTPQVVSIGPLHHGKKGVRNMEDHKLIYLAAFFGRPENKSHLEEFVGYVNEHEPKIRACYSEKLNHLSRDLFVELIVVDAVFIIELFLRNFVSELIKENFVYRLPSSVSGDYSLIQHELSEFNNIDVEQDLILLENQLPFFVLDDLYSKAALAGPPHSFRDLASHYFFHEYTSIDNDIKHFTDFVRTNFLLSYSKTEHRSCHRSHPCEQPKSILTMAKRCFLGSADVDPDIFEHVYSATELREAGVKIKMSSSKCLFEVKFSKGVLEIPRLTVEYGTEAFFKNLIALEECHYPSDAHVCDYICLMDCLINTEEDVELLVKKKIIVHRLGNHQAVANLINKLSSEIRGHRYGRYIILCRKLQVYIEHHRHGWKATLKHEYFSNPWRVVSLIAAGILLVLTLIQTICSILSLSRSS